MDEIFTKFHVKYNCLGESGNLSEDYVVSPNCNIRDTKKLEKIRRTNTKTGRRARASAAVRWTRNLAITTAAIKKDKKATTAGN